MYVCRNSRNTVQKHTKKPTLAFSVLHVFRSGNKNSLGKVKKTFKNEI